MHTCTYTQHNFSLFKMCDRLFLLTYMNYCLKKCHFHRYSQQQHIKSQMKHYANVRIVALGNNSNISETSIKYAA